MTFLDSLGGEKTIWASDTEAKERNNLDDIMKELSALSLGDLLSYGQIRYPAGTPEVETLVMLEGIAAFSLQSEVFWADNSKLDYWIDQGIPGSVAGMVENNLLPPVTGWENMTHTWE